MFVGSVSRIWLMVCLFNYPFFLNQLLIHNFKKIISNKYLKTLNKSKDRLFLFQFPTEFQAKRKRKQKTRKGTTKWSCKVKKVSILFQVCFILILFQFSFLLLILFQVCFLLIMFQVRSLSLLFLVSFLLLLLFRVVYYQYFLQVNWLLFSILSLHILNVLKNTTLIF